ncbi:MAG: ammonium transporter [Acutalibacteraceae bacterium]|nr:ammonium transporter [Acutalibacteraceae bacterium]
MDANGVHEAVNEALTSTIFGTEGVWFLIGAALVFFMQCGFAMVETGFTRAKNAGNIIMKNLMDFCIGTIVFILIGFSLLCGENMFFGLIGRPDLQIFTNFSDFPWHNFVFNLVFCATAATIVSGAMAERTKFISYCVYSGVISAVIYPIEAHWIWGGGWLVQLGFVDFAGSCAIHMVGGISALIGAAILGPRIGKFVKDKKTGKVVPKAIPGHSLTLGALGVFILWFGWYGFNGAAASSTDYLGQIFLTTTIAPAVATVVTMTFTWLKHGKPDISMSLNASLAGLVAITAPCADVDALGAIIIGAVAGLLVVFGVWFLDYVLKVDDPVGAVAVHGFNGVWGTLAVGLFATGNGQNGITGLFYGGGFKQLGIQAVGLLAVAVWTAVTVTILFFIIKNTIGLRASKEEEMVGLDVTEHGLVSSYADFMPAIVSNASLDEPTPSVTGEVPVAQAVPVQVVQGAATPASDVKISKVDIILKQSKLEDLKNAMDEIGITGMTVTQVLGCGVQKGKAEYYRGVPVEMNLLPKMQVEIVVSKVPVQDVIDAAVKALYTGHIGDGKIFIYDVQDVVKVRTGERGYDALQGEDD